MNKKQVDKWIPTAISALTKYGIAENGKIDSTFRGQISAFGAAIIMGSFESAVAFYSQQGASDVPRERLLCAMHYIITEEDKQPIKIFEEICGADNLTELQNKYIDASIALKLAMNFFDLGKGDKAKEEQGEKS